MGKTLLVGTLVAILVGASLWAAWVWARLGDAEISTDGTIALTLGIVVSVVVGVGLMALVFVSARRGFDEQVTYDFGEGEDAEKPGDGGEAGSDRTA